MMNSSRDGNLGFKVIVLVCVMVVIFWGEPDLLDAVIQLLLNINTR